ncbi:MAG: hypothetical protein ACKV19_02760 [Verrucomicrobiales bacterium]
MKNALFSLFLGIAPLWVPVIRGQDDPPPPPEENQGHEAHEKAEARMQEETIRFTREMEERMKGAMEKAAALEAEGKHDAAEEMRKEARDKLESSIQEHRRAMQEKMREHQQHQQHQRAERQERAAREHAERRERPQADRPDGERRPDGPHAPELERKLHHVEQAIGHLREADLPDPAQNLERVANRLRQALHDHREHGPRPEGGPPRVQQRHDDDLAALRRDVEELKKLVAGLCKMQGHSEKKEADEKHH